MEWQYGHLAMLMELLSWHFILSCCYNKHYRLKHLDELIQLSCVLLKCFFFPSHLVRYNITWFSRESDYKETLTRLYCKAPDTSGCEERLSPSRLCGVTDTQCWAVSGRGAGKAGLDQLAGRAANMDVKQPFTCRGQNLTWSLGTYPSCAFFSAVLVW